MTMLHWRHSELSHPFRATLWGSPLEIKPELEEHYNMHAFALRLMVGDDCAIIVLGIGAL